MRGLYPAGSFEQTLLTNSRMPATATSVVRLESFSRRSDAMVSLDQGREALDAIRADRTYTYDIADRVDIFIDPSPGDTLNCSG